MDELNLNLSPSVWNIIKYVTLSLILTPTFEFLLHRLIQQKARWDLLRGRTVALSDTGLGVFSIHSTFWGRSRNKYILLVIGTFIIAIELLLEFSFSSKPVAISKTEQVWGQPDHEQRYLISGRKPRLSPEPALFPVEATKIQGCLEGDFNMRRREIPNDENEITLVEYWIDATYAVRRPYLSAIDNTTLYCGAGQNVQDASFFVPFATKFVNNDLEEDGFDYFGNFEDRFYNRSIYTDVGMELRLKSNWTIDDTVIYMYEGKNSVCMDSGSRTTAEMPPLFLLCGLRAQSTFSLAVGSLHEDGKQVSISTIVMEMSGPALSSLVKQDGRQKRFLLSNMFMNHGRSPEDVRMIRKTTLEQIAQVALIVANEEGVAGIRREKSSREVFDGFEEQASVKRLAIIPGAIIVAMLLVFVLLNVVLAIRIAKVQGNTEQHSVRISTQFLRRQMRKDVMGMRTGDKERQKTGYRLVENGDEQRVQLLPQLTMVHT